MRDEHFGISVVEFMAAGAVAWALFAGMFAGKVCVSLFLGCGT